MTPCCDPNCRTVQIIEPDPTLGTGTGGGTDPSITEQGSVILSPMVGLVNVQFGTVKAGDYRFEFLYVDALGLTTPEIIPVVPVTQTIYGFTVDLGAYPIQDGYILRWRVFVFDVTTTPGSLVDTPESLRVQLPISPEVFEIFTVNFTNPRSSTTYGFSELRVENLIDDPITMYMVLVQVIAKTKTSFSVIVFPTPPTNNYFLVVRTP